MKNKGAKTKLKKKSSIGAFGCDLTEYLESSGQDVPDVLKSCAEFIETHGVVDGIYRLSGVTSNIQKLRQEFGLDQPPDLTRDVYLQDIHCVGSLCKLYFRELPNPLLTYQLYSKFTEAVSCSVDGEKLFRILEVIQELPPSHYRTLEYLSKHLTHIASHSSTTNMHIRNLALVWAPNLLRSKEIEDVGCNGDAAFMEVRVQQVVIEFILNNVDQIFNKIPAAPMKQKEECRVMMMKSLTLPSGSLPMKLVSLEEAQAMSLSATHPARKERRENSLPEIVPITGSLFHTVIDLPENKRKLSTKSKKWKSIFNLGRSGTETKTKLSRNGSVFVRGQKEMSDKATIRPAKSMESLCSLPAEGEDEKVSRFKRSVATGGFFIPTLKSRATGTGSAYDVSKHEIEWDAEDVTGATGGLGSGQTNGKSAQPKPPPEQMKVFRVGDDLDSEQTSPNIRKMFYSAGDGAAKSSFPGSLFPLEASPRHQRKAMNISEPFAVSVPLRVSAVINTNSTPCRGSAKDRPLLSSLEELPLLDPDKIDRISKSATLEKCSHTGIKEKPRSPTIGNSDKHVGPKRTCSNESDSENEATLTIKEILLEMLLEQEASEVAQKKLAAEQAPPPADDLQAAASSPPSGPDPDSTRSQQVENPKNQPEQTFHIDQEDTPLSFLDPLWSDIQQELKIIESEEEFPVSEPSTDFKELPSPSVLPEGSSDTVQPTPDFRQSPLLPEVNNGGAVVNLLVIDNPGIQPNDSHQKQDSIQPPQERLENIPQNADFDLPVEATESLLLPQENQLCKEHEGHVIGEKEIWNCDTEKGNSTLGFFEPVPIKSETGNSNLTLLETQEKDNLQVIVDTAKSSRDKNVQMLRLERKSSGSLDNDDELGGDNAQPFELEEFWEDHQWVTSPLHSPKLKNMTDKDAPSIQPKRRGTTGELYKRPEFTRSLSLDSKDTRASKWTCKFVGINRVDGLLHPRSETDMSVKQNSHNDSEQSRHLAKTIDLSPAENQNTSSSGENNKNNKENGGDSLLQVPLIKSHETFHSTLMLPAIPVNSVEVQNRNGPPTVSNSEKTVENSHNKEEAPGKPKTRPSSLSLDTSNPADELFTFERAASCGSSDIGAQKIHATTKIPNDINQGKGDSWTLHSSLQTKDNDLYVPAAHAPSGRRNSAPVSVSAVRASFMIKMCQAKAVPVIPPKVQYTQIPQPLHTVNTDSEVLPEEKKELLAQPECNSISSQTLAPCNAHVDKPKVPKPEKEVVEEKENNDPISDSSHQSHQSNGSSQAESRVVSQDAPILRRKRTSDGEASGDTPLSSKMDRPSGFSKPNFRSRPGRPQSLILFSPPFPIMDHPSPADSRILLSPIKSPTHTTTQESALENQMTPDGVVLRNKLTIPKNGQRLETSTSCFYQPQRRSVILDSRSGRQIE
ncbi:rho GTPase-activating protein 31 isoform X2 [Xenopus laevis]|uniref:Rho GTPase-activating protein 31 isoform X2 n=1 Tax=Xenopus laevis TaxID=8355 RepID=A0A8J0UDB5_XENLA|nr:rho GTPase-activating protein 31 isoform X2 [Xenopus laevis]